MPLTPTPEGGWIRTCEAALSIKTPDDSTGFHSLWNAGDSFFGFPRLGGFQGSYFGAIVLLYS